MTGKTTPNAAGRTADNAVAAPSRERDVSAACREIIADVRRRGDDALKELASRFDGVTLDALEVPRAACLRALDSLPAELRRAMERSARNIATVHRAFVPAAMEVESEPGILIGRRPDPLRRVGVYAPGGRAAYPSSVLMGAIPARVAGVEEIVLCTPPDRSGAPAPVILAAAALAEVDRVFALGGAGAIAAMALGTASVPRVDRVVGPGNAYVAEAKLQLSSEVGIDSPAGPSELLVIADDSADPRVVATEMIAQAEHDPMARVVAVAIGTSVAEAIGRALTEATRSASRNEIVSAALRDYGGVIVVPTIDAAILEANDRAPEHLLLITREADRVLPLLRNAGTIFVGATSSVAFGDYMTGANHVLPTGGMARIYSGLSTLDFVRWTTYQRIDRAAAARLSADVALFAEAESLPGHAAAARQWSTP